MPDLFDNLDPPPAPAEEAPPPKPLSALDRRLAEALAREPPPGPPPPWKQMHPISYRTLLPLLERGEVSVTVFHRRHLLLAIADYARKSKGHTPQSRGRLQKFREQLDALEGNDEIEVPGETFCEVVMLAMEATPEYL